MGLKDLIEEHQNLVQEMREKGVNDFRHPEKLRPDLMKKATSMRSKIYQKLDLYIKSPYVQSKYKGKEVQCIDELKKEMETHFGFEIPFDYVFGAIESEIIKKAKEDMEKYKKENNLKI